MKRRPPRSGRSSPRSRGSRLPPGALARIKLGRSGRRGSLGVSADGERVVVATPDGTVRLFDAATGHEVQTLGLGRQGGTWDEFHRIAHSPDGRAVAFLKDSGIEVFVMRLDGGATIVPSLRAGRRFESLAFSPDGGALALGEEVSGEHGTQGRARIAICDLAPDETRFSPEPQEGGDIIRCVAYSPDGARVAAIDNLGFFRLWDADGMQVVRDFGRQHFNEMVFSPDGSYLASFGFGSEILTWPAGGRPGLAELLGEGRWPASLGGHILPVTAVAFSPDGSRIASGSWDCTVRLRDVSGARPGDPGGAGRAWGCEVGRLRGRKAVVAGLALFPDGARLASMDDRGEILIWEVPGRG